jgi:hypothetical protein
MSSYGAPLAPRVLPRGKPRLSAFLDTLADEEDLDIESPFRGERAAISHRVVEVTSKGDVNASFGILGTVSIPSDGDSHNITVVKLDLPLEREWVAVPRKEVSVHMMVGLYFLFF